MRDFTLDPRLNAIVGGRDFQSEGFVRGPIPTHPSSWCEMPLNMKCFNPHAGWSIE